MSSIQRIQTERLLEDVAHSLYSKGVKPTTSEIKNLVSKHFSDYPAGLPLPVPLANQTSGQVSNPKEFTRFIENTTVNLDVLYESMVRQLAQAIQLVSTMSDDMKRLGKKRRELEALIDDYLLSTVNAEGYFYAVSDVFSNLNRLDLNLTSAQINVAKGEVSLPSVPYTTQRVAAEEYRTVQLNALVNGEAGRARTRSAFVNALDTAAENTHWQVEVETDQPSEVVLTVDIPLRSMAEISRISIDPYGVEPVQIALSSLDDGTFVPFGNRAATINDEFSFTSRPVSTTMIRMVMRKKSYDYIESEDKEISYRYVFGARSFEMLKTTYDYDARIVSKPLRIEEDLQDDTAIDAVSVQVDEYVPDGTSIRYYVGASNGSSEEIGDINWQPITPVNSMQEGSKVVRFNSTNTERVVARLEPTAGDDLQLVPIKEYGPISDQNPSLQIFPGVEMYRITEINESALKNSLELVEGLNTLRIYSRPYDLSTDFEDIDILYWADKFDDNRTSVDYARIDGGNDFFYGGSVGASAQDVLVETFVSSDKSYATFLAQFVKSDTRSRTWDVKIYLNGREIGHLPAGTDKSQLPWNLNKGLNHVVLLIRIPDGNSSFLGTLRLLEEKDLFDYGLVHLQQWKYVDPFEMRYNERGTNNPTFTIVDGEIVSRRPPTDNFQVRYALKNGQEPDYVRFRADLTRADNSPTMTPTLSEYRLRFAYGD